GRPLACLLGEQSQVERNRARLNPLPEQGTLLRLEGPPSAHEPAVYHCPRFLFRHRPEFEAEIGRDVLFDDRARLTGTTRNDKRHTGRQLTREPVQNSTLIPRQAVQCIEKQHKWPCS